MTSLPLDFHVWDCMKSVVFECKVKREELHPIIFSAAGHMNDPDVLHKVYIILSLK
jgi:hypothetical protein